MYRSLSNIINVLPPTSVHLGPRSNTGLHIPCNCHGLEFPPMRKHLTFFLSRPSHVRRTSTSRLFCKAFLSLGFSQFCVFEKRASCPSQCTVSQGT